MSGETSEFENTISNCDIHHFVFILQKRTETYSVTIVTSVPWDTPLVLRLDKDAYGKKPFFSWTEVYFNHAVKLHDYWFVQW